MNSSGVRHIDSVYGRQQSEANDSFLRSVRDGNLNLVLEHLDYAGVHVTTSNANGLTALHLASKTGHTDVVIELLKRAAPVDALTKKGNTSLHIASLAGHTNVVEILLQYGAKVNLQSSAGFTALYMAAQEDHAEVVKLLLDHGADQHIATSDGCVPMTVAVQRGHQTVITLLIDNDTSYHRVRLPALHVAAKRDDVRAATLLLQHDTSRAKSSSVAVDLATRSGFTALHMAAHYGSENVARLLINCGADVNFMARNDIAPLHVASKWGRTAIVSLLIDNHANIEALTKDRLTALHCATRSGKHDAAFVLVQRGATLSAKTRNSLTPLHMATQGDHTDCIELLLTSGAHIDDVSIDYLTALHVAAHCGNVRSAEILLNNHCTIDARALNGFTPLHVACKKSRIPVIELLLRYGAHVQSTTESGLTSLHVAAFMGHVHVVTYLLDNAAASLETTTARDETALHVAARARQTDVIRVLLDHGANVDARAKDGQTALHVSSRLGDYNTVQLLLQHSADVDALMRDHYTPLHIAVKHQHSDIISILLSHSAKLDVKSKKGFTALHVAAKYGHVEATKLLLQDKRTDVNVTGKNALTALHVATHYDNLDVVLLLMEHAANTHAVAKNGYTALHIAAKMNRVDIAKVLLRYGANADAQSKSGYTPVHLAAQEGHVEMLALLLGPAGKVPVNSQAYNGLSALHLAAQEDHLALAQVLVDHSCTIDLQTKAGYTPLHTACHFGKLDMVQFLLRHNADVNSATLASYTPLHVAAQEGHLPVVNVLLEYNASPDALTADGETALSIARHVGFERVADRLLTVTSDTTDSPSPSATDRQYCAVFPETMCELVNDSDDEGTGDSRLSTPLLSRHSQDDESRASQQVAGNVYRQGQAQDDLFSFEDSGRQSRTSWVWGGSQAGRDYLEEEVRYMREAGAVTPSSLDAPDHDAAEGLLMTPDTADVDAKYLMRLDSRPLADDGMTPGTPADYFNTPRQQQQQQQQHPLSDAVRARYVDKNPRHAVSEDMNDEVMEDNVVMSTQITQTQSSPADTTRRLYGSSVYSETSFGSASLMSERVVRSPLHCGFLVSFVVDARGAVMLGRRHSGLRFIIPPSATSHPTRVRCKLVSASKLSCPPPLTEADALAARVIDLGQTRVKFDRAVLLEVAHFAAVRDAGREVCVLRSDNGVTWSEHQSPASDDDISAVLQDNFDNVESAEKVFDLPVVRIIVTDLPQYLAVVSRVRVESQTLGPAGGLLSSTVVPQAQVVFPHDAIVKPIRVGLQVLRVPETAVDKVVAERRIATGSVSASPVVSVEPRVRKFHQPVTITIPLPPHSRYRDNRVSNTNSLRLLCSMSGGREVTQWTDVTGSVPLRLVDGCVSFTSVVSARYWLIDCQSATSTDVSQLANALFGRLLDVPFVAKFVVFARAPSQTETRLRVFCVTDDRLDKTLERHQMYREVARSQQVEMVEGETVDVRLQLPNMKPLKSRLSLVVSPLRENRLDVTSRSGDVAGHVTRDVIGQLVVVKADSLAPVCALNFPLPAADGEPGHVDRAEREVDEEMIERVLRRKKKSSEDDETVGEEHSEAQLRLTDIADTVHDDWQALAAQLGVTDSVIDNIIAQYNYPSEQCLVMLQRWFSQHNDVISAAQLLRDALRDIGRHDVITQCMTVHQQVPGDDDGRQQAFNALVQQLTSMESDAAVSDGDVNDLDTDQQNNDVMVAGEAELVVKTVRVDRTQTQPHAEAVTDSDVIQLADDMSRDMSHPDMSRDMTRSADSDIDADMKTDQQVTLSDGNTVLRHSVVTEIHAESGYHGDNDVSSRGDAGVETDVDRSQVMTLTMTSRDDDTEQTISPEQLDIDGDHVTAAGVHVTDSHVTTDTQPRSEGDPGHQRQLNVDVVYTEPQSGYHGDDYVGYYGDSEPVTMTSVTSSVEKTEDTLDDGTVVRTHITTTTTNQTSVVYTVSEETDDVVPAAATVDEDDTNGPVKSLSSGSDKSDDERDVRRDNTGDDDGDDGGDDDKESGDREDLE